MKRPSTRTVVITGVSFALGFIVATALAIGFVLWFARLSLHANQGWIVNQLVTTNQLLAATDKQRIDLRTMIISNADEQSLTAAAMFDAMGRTYQPMVLRQFARLNKSTTPRADPSRRGRTALLARLMVLCSRDSANPGVVQVNKNVTFFAGIPGWVLDPDAAPVAPTPLRDAGVEQTPEVLSAEFKKWTTLHEWVKANQACIATQASTS